MLADIVAGGKALKSAVSHMMIAALADGSRATEALLATLSDARAKP